MVTGEYSRTGQKDVRGSEGLTVEVDDVSLVGNDCGGIKSAPWVVCAVATNGDDDNLSSREAQEGQKLIYKRSVRYQMEQFGPTAKTVEMRTCIGIFGKGGGERREGRS